MRKNLLIYAAILAGLFIFLSILDLKGDYVVEQKLWKVNRLYAEVAKDPNAVSGKTFDQLAKKYQRIINQYPKSDVVQGAYLLLGEVYLLKKDYKTAREKFESVVVKYPDNKELAAEAKARVGRSYELENKWPEALKVYRSIIKEYPLTNVGMSTPLFLAGHYKNKNDYQNAMQAYAEAIQFYRNLANQNPDTVFGFNALRFLANCYLDQNRWKEAVDVLGETLISYAHSSLLNVPRADLMIKTINMIAAFQLKDNDVAVNVYRKFIDKYPAHPLSSYLQKMIDAFTKLEQEGVQVSPQK
ncbi:MAG: tetratricopeptide repeat protein [Candidatus Omnitrophota bacterium]